MFSYDNSNLNPSLFSKKSKTPKGKLTFFKQNFLLQIKKLVKTRKALKTTKSKLRIAIEAGGACHWYEISNSASSAIELGIVS